MSIIGLNFRNHSLRRNFNETNEMITGYVTYLIIKKNNNFFIQISPLYAVNYRPGKKKRYHSYLNFLITSPKKSTIMYLREKKKSN